MNPYEFREFRNLPIDGVNGRIPLPPTEYVFRSVEYVRRNWLPLAGIVIGIGSQVIPLAVAV